MNITNIGQNRVATEQTNSVASKKDAITKKGSDVASAQAGNQVTLSKMSQVLGSNDKKNAAVEEKEDFSSANFSASNMMQAQTGHITPEFVASLLERNPYTA